MDLEIAELMEENKILSDEINQLLLNNEKLQFENYKLQIKINKLNDRLGGSLFEETLDDLNYKIRKLEYDIIAKNKLIEKYEIINNGDNQSYYRKCLEVAKKSLVKAGYKINILEEQIKVSDDRINELNNEIEILNNTINNNQYKKICNKCNKPIGYLKSKMQQPIPQNNKYFKEESDGDKILEIMFKNITKKECLYPGCNNIRDNKKILGCNKNHHEKYIEEYIN